MGRVIGICHITRPPGLVTLHDLVGVMHAPLFSLDDILQRLVFASAHIFSSQCCYRVLNGGCLTCIRWFCPFYTLSEQKPGPSNTVDMSVRRELRQFADPRRAKRLRLKADFFFFSPFRKKSPQFLAKRSKKTDTVTPDAKKHYLLETASCRRASSDSRWFSTL